MPVTMQRAVQIASQLSAGLLFSLFSLRAAASWAFMPAMALEPGTKI